MIQIDKELEWRLNSRQKNLREIITEIKIKKIIGNIIFIFVIIYSFLICKGLSYYITNTNFLIILATIFFWVTFIFAMSYEKYLENDIHNLQQKQVYIEKEIEDIKDFSVYLLSYRKLDAINNGKDIYPEIRYNDAKYNVEHFKDIYEEKRIEYEKQHQKRVELNKKQ